MSRSSSVLALAALAGALGASPVDVSAALPPRTNGHGRRGGKRHTKAAMHVPERREKGRLARAARKRNRGR